MLKFIFRIAFVLLGAFLLYLGSSGLYKPLLFKTQGVQVEGEIIGFYAGKYGASVQPESKGMRNGRNRARRPAFRFPLGNAAGDSLTGKESAPQIFQKYQMGQVVQVVYPQADPADARIFDMRELGGWLLLILGGLVMGAMGIFPKWF